MSNGHLSVEELLKQSNVYLGILARAQLRDVIARELKDAKRKKLYELTDGTKSVKELATLTGMSTGTISETWQEWEASGLIIKEGRSYKRALG